MWIDRDGVSEIKGREIIIITINGGGNDKTT